MKFFVCAAFLVVGAFLVSASDLPGEKQINKAKDAVKGAVDDAKDALGDLGSEIKNLPKGSALLEPIISGISGVVQSITTAFAKPITDALDKVLDEVNSTFVRSFNEIKNLESCAQKSGNDIDVTLPLKELSQCVDAPMDQISTIINDSVGTIDKVVSSVTSSVSGGVACLSQDFLFIPMCIGGEVLKSVLHMSQIISGMIKDGSSIGLEILGVIPSGINCMTNATNNVVQNFTTTGLNLVDCAQKN